MNRRARSMPRNMDCADCQVSDIWFKMAEGGKNKQNNGGVNAEIAVKLLKPMRLYYF